MAGNKRVALVTGTTSGLGREVALALAAQGVHVLAHGRDATRLEAVGAEVRAAGGQVDTYLADLADLSQVRALAERVGADHPELAILVNNAGVGGGPPPHTKREVSADGYELRFATELTAYRIVQEALTNTRKHASATRADVILDHGPRSLRITVTDDGRPGAAQGGGTGHGLIGMRERAAAVGGTVTAGPRPEGGFQVVADLPLSLTPTTV
ncbi:SDR family NAD(P)-dependent oxidoreductase [Streptomyces griseorubiginosus]|uniref:SDR family NAD(P)-dependent oxidoreductase n=1 Tax=Streptomyces griseorubiginosus TaxID=67304 RepID=UPI001AD7877F|nr:SDR family NAD(P)-dependent oxidoreductase [Streptomyces griseorubiginosus]